MMHNYALFGLTLRSHLPIPELDADDGATPASLSIEAEAAKVFAHLLSVAGDGMAVSHRKGCFAAWMPGIGGLSVGAGRIGVLIDDGSDWESMRPYLLGMGLAVAMYKLRLLPHHVSAVSLAGAAIAFTGESGAGKSTMGYEWQRQFGAELISDDLARIDAKHSPPLIYPGLARVKLWPDALQEFSLSSDGLSRELHGRDKYFLEDVTRAKRPLPLSALILLESDSDLTEPRIQVLRGSQRLIAARASLYRPEIAGLLNSESVLTSDLLAFCASVPIYQFVRPRQLGLLSSGACQLRDHLAADGLLEEVGDDAIMQSEILSE